MHHNSSKQTCTDDRAGPSRYVGSMGKSRAGVSKPWHPDLAEWRCMDAGTVDAERANARPPLQFEKRCSVQARGRNSVHSEQSACYVDANELSLRSVSAP